MGLPSGAALRFTATDGLATGGVEGSFPPHAASEMAATANAVAETDEDLERKDIIMTMLDEAVDRVGVMIVQLPHLPQSVRVPREHTPRAIASTQTNVI